MKKKLFTITDPIYKNVFGVFVGYSWLELRSYIKENQPHLLEKIDKDKPGIGLYQDFDEKDGSKSRIIWLETADKSVMVHEIFHAMSHSLRQRGMKLSDESEEAWAYYFEYLFDQINKNLTTKS
jgi:hypothetical protein